MDQDRDLCMAAVQNNGYARTTAEPENADPVNYSGNDLHYTHKHGLTGKAKQLALIIIEILRAADVTTVSVEDNRYADGRLPDKMVQDHTNRFSFIYIHGDDEALEITLYNNGASYTAQFFLTDERIYCSMLNPIPESRALHVIRFKPNNITLRCDGGK